MNKPTVSVVIPNYNGEKLLEKNIPPLLKASKNSSNNIIEIIVVDDGSIDESVKVIHSNFPELKLIKHKINRGFSAAVNTGVRMSKGDLIVLLNTDVIPEEDFLKSVFKHFEENKVFAVSLNEIGSFAWAKGFFADGYVGHSTGEKSSTPHDTFWVSGGSGVFRRSTWMSLGGMDEKLLSPFYWEDLDLSYRALKRGYKLIWDPDAKVTHVHEATISTLPKKYVQRILERNQLLFIWKNITSGHLFKKHLGGLFRRLAKHPGYIRIVFMALGRINVLLKARRKEMKEAKVSDEMIFSRF